MHGTVASQQTALFKETTHFQEPEVIPGNQLVNHALAKMKNWQIKWNSELTGSVEGLKQLGKLDLACSSSLTNGLSQSCC